MKKFTFGTSQKIKGKKSVEELFSSGSSFHYYPFLVKYLPDPSSDRSSILISVPKRHHKSAVKRNRIKRRIREGYRLNQGILDSAKTAFKIGFIYLSDEILTSEVIHKKLIDVLLRLSYTDLQ